VSIFIDQKIFFQQNVVLGEFFIAKISNDSDRTEKKAVQKRTIIGLYGTLVIGRIQNFATFDEILRYFAKISPL
jgi:RNA recognition motif-containing protein